MPIKAYQGSPNLIQPEPDYPLGRYKDEYIGSGEGAQAYGHGHYFAENPEVANTYRYVNSGIDPDETTYGGKPISHHYNEAMAARDAANRKRVSGPAMSRLNAEAGFWEKLMTNWHPDNAISEANTKDFGWPEYTKFANSLDRSKFNVPKAGHMYEVAINANPDHFLDWDKPLSDQPQHIQDFAKSITVPNDTKRSYVVMKNWQQGIDMGHPVTGSTLHTVMSDYGTDLAAQRALSKKMQDAGIPGIKYLDQSSRAKGEGTRNYVVFDPSHVDIKNRYAKGGITKAEGGPIAAPVGGFPGMKAMPTLSAPQNSQATQAMMAAIPRMQESGPVSNTGYAPYTPAALPQRLAAVGVQPKVVPMSAEVAALKKQFPTATMDQLSEYERAIAGGGDPKSTLSLMKAYSPASNYTSHQPWSPDFKGFDYSRSRPTDEFGNPIGWTPTAEDEASRQKSLAVSGGKAGYAPLDFPDQYRPDDEYILNNPWTYGMTSLGGNVMPGEIGTRAAERSSQGPGIAQANASYQEGKKAAADAEISKIESMYNPENIGALGPVDANQARMDAVTQAAQTQGMGAARSLGGDSLPGRQSSFFSAPNNLSAGNALQLGFSAAAATPFGVPASVLNAILTGTNAIPQAGDTGNRALNAIAQQGRMTNWGADAVNWGWRQLGGEAMQRATGGRTQACKESRKAIMIARAKGERPAQYAYGGPVEGDRELDDSGFYNAAAEAAQGIPQAKGTPQQMLSMVQKAPGTQETMKWSGADQAFAGQPIVSKDDLVKHFQTNAPKLEETQLGGKGGITEDKEKISSWLEKRAAERAAESGDIDDVKEFKTSNSEIRNWHLKETQKDFDEQKATDPDFIGQFHTRGSGEPTKYHEYTIPGGENYREILLKAPPNKSPERDRMSEIENRRADIQKELMKLNDDELYRHLSTEGTANVEDFTKEKIRLLSETENLKNEYKSLVPKTQNIDFNSSHWGGHPNVVAHLRMSDRTLPQTNEKALHLEELQSDWGQAGREGFKKSPEELAAMKNDMQDAHKNYLALHGAGAPSDELKAAEDKYNAAMDKWGKASKVTTPEGPYVGNTGKWTDLGLKRALIEAARGGHDKLIWTPGDEQALRYKENDEENDAKRLKGMNKYYGEIVPSQLEKILRSIGHTAEFGTDYIKVKPYEADLDVYKHAVTGKYHVATGDKRANPDAEDMESGPFNTHGEAVAHRDLLYKGLKAVPSLKITPAMRETISKGLPRKTGGFVPPARSSAVEQALKLTSKSGATLPAAVFLARQHQRRD